MFFALCDGIADSIYATGATEEEASAELWRLVKAYLVNRQAPHTSEMTPEELSEYFGSVVWDLTACPYGFLRG
jgi:hypothetical protein